MINTLELFSNREKDGLKNHELRRVLVDVIKWSMNHLNPLLESVDLQKGMPKFLWYGDMKRSQPYFVHYLMKLGCDLVIFHPEGKDTLAGFIEEGIFTHHFSNKQPAEPFPKRREEIAKRLSPTVHPARN